MEYIRPTIQCMGNLKKCRILWLRIWLLLLKLLKVQPASVNTVGLLRMRSLTTVCTLLTTKGTRERVSGVVSTNEWLWRGVPYPIKWSIFSPQCQKNKFKTIIALYYSFNCTNLGKLIVGKISKIAATRSRILKLMCTKSPGPIRDLLLTFKGKGEGQGE